MEDIVSRLVIEGTTSGYRGYEPTYKIPLTLQVESRG